MNPTAAIFDTLVLYRYSLILSLSAGAGLCLFMACCSNLRISSLRAAGIALTAVLLSLPLARLVFWYGRPDSFSSLFHALTASSSEAFALAGAFAGCILAALLGGKEDRCKYLDCMSVAGCAAIALGRLGSFFSTSGRGQIMTHLTGLPWAYSVANASGHLEYRFATFLFQAAAAAILGVFLAVRLYKKRRPGEVFLLFVLIYSASQIILDSTRYDSLCLRSNGFISIVQLLSAAALLLVIVLLCVRTILHLGFRYWMIPMWTFLAGLFAGTGYMEYYVQRHGREAAFAYTIMAGCLLGIISIGFLMLHLSQYKKPACSKP